MSTDSIEPLKKLISAFHGLPGIGEKTAERLAFHILKADKEEAMELAYAVRDVKENVKPCSTCFNLSDEDPCRFCTDDRRDSTKLCVVEQPADLWAIEKTGLFRGRYHVLMGRLAPLDNVNPEDLTLSHLAARVEKGGIEEIILATNPTVEGDATALYIQRMFQDRPVELTRIAKGIPAGSSLEFANRNILVDALEGRRNF
jgi:recombination protein RecR